MNTLLVTILGGIGFFLLIIASIVLHEIGHFLPAKRFGVRVAQFFVGFGKNLWSTKKGETEYGVKLVPLGGYVRLMGMYPPYKEGKNTRLKRIADSAREAEWDDISEEDVANQRLYYQKPVWQRLIIMFGGVAMNIILAFGLFLGVNLTYGQYQASMRIGYVAQCLEPEPAECVAPPAAQMGLQVGDIVLEFNGTPYTKYDDFTTAIRANKGGSVQLTVLRDDKRLTLPTVSGMTRMIADPNDPTQGIEVGFLGINVYQERVKIGPGGTLKQMWEMTTLSVKAIAKLPVSAVKVLVDMVTGQERDPDGPISIFGASAIAGEVIAIDAPASARIAFFLQLLASLNLFIGLFNLVPLPPFDGGHIAVGVWEKIKRSWAKGRGKPDPGPADSAKLLPITYVMFVLLILMGVIMIVADIVSPVSLF
ncbi:MAG: M50 family metallopeptidase [Propionibacteriaceae bacterium]|jgi:membrane-associated protease RseP (regulator of RpoE activity)|nr:M50 family metallopeptidase [Propionibacteriaceae bacterium]